MAQASTAPCSFSVQQTQHDLLWPAATRTRTNASPADRSPANVSSRLGVFKFIPNSDSDSERLAPSLQLSDWLLGLCWDSSVSQRPPSSLALPSHSGRIPSRWSSAPSLHSVWPTGEPSHPVSHARRSSMNPHWSDRSRRSRPAIRPLSEEPTRDPTALGGAERDHFQARFSEWRAAAFNNTLRMPFPLNTHLNYRSEAPCRLSRQGARPRW
jgi:hypothetical protein